MKLNMVWMLSVVLAIADVPTAAGASLQWVSDDRGLENYAPQISGNGRFVLYTEDWDSRIQYVVADLSMGTKELVSRNADGQPMNQPTTPMVLGDPVLTGGALSDDGRFVAFASTATNLVPGTVGRRQRVYLFDRTSGSMMLVDEQPGDQGQSGGPFGDSELERMVYITTGTVPGELEVRLFERSTGEKRKLLTHRTEDQLGGQPSHELSGNGRYLLFGTRANGWVPGDQNNAHDVFRMDLSTNEVVRVSVNADGIDSGGNSYEGRISDDGQRVSFLSTGGNWLPVGGLQGVNGFVKDLADGSLVLANAFDGSPAGEKVDDLVISGDGSTISFRARFASGSGENGRYHIYRRRLDEPRNSMVDVNAEGASGNHDCHVGALSPPILSNLRQYNPSLSDDGLRVAFSCYASNLLPGVSGMHVYVRSYAGTPNSALPIPSQGAWGLSLLVAGVAGLGLWSVRRAGGAGAAV